LKSLEKLLYLRGISSEYFNHSGERVAITHKTRLNFLRAMNYDVDDAQQVDEAVFDLDAKPWQSWLPERSFARQGAIELRFHPDELLNSFEYKITGENNRCARGSFAPSDLLETGEYYIGDVRYTARQWTLPEISFGYHNLHLSTNGVETSCKLIFAPDQCYQLPAEPADDKILGISCQLYTLRSERNWGIGDFSDLRELIDLSVDFGIDLIGLNPLHAQMPGETKSVSPYSPSDRRFLNPIYLAPELIPELHNSSAIEAYLNNPKILSTLDKLRALEKIDYLEVAATKNKLFTLLFQEFLTSHLAKQSSRAKQFSDFVTETGEKLKNFCDFEVAQAKASQTSSDESSNHLFDRRYYAYLQWITQEQLAGCQLYAVERGMRVGLMADLAVGAIKSGAEVSSNPGLYATKATIGAPADQFTDKGQNWDLPVIDPTTLKADGYKLFIDLMQANMANSGALRIDHVMGLMRLWWWLESSGDGAYVYYPLEHMLSILRLESHRNKCLVVGEDLGVVPDEFREKMVESAITGSKIFLFETDYDGRFLDPKKQPRDALLMVTNHDVPTLAGWWAAHDIHSRNKYNLFDSTHELASQLEQRHNQKSYLLEWLHELDLLPEEWLSELDKLTNKRPLDLTLCKAIIRAIARTNCQFMLYQLEDLQLITEPVNIPGTFLEYPNWQRKQHRNTSAIFADTQISSMLTSIHNERLQ